ncbi:MAG TPA: hypothetical protein VF604_07405 [Pyrinomonadaceae bacterium]
MKKIVPGINCFTRATANDGIGDSMNPDISRSSGSSANVSSGSGGGLLGGVGNPVGGVVAATLQTVSGVSKYGGTISSRRYPSARTRHKRN